MTTNDSIRTWLTHCLSVAIFTERNPNCCMNKTCKFLFNPHFQLFHVRGIIQQLSKRNSIFSSLDRELQVLRQCERGLDGKLLIQGLKTNKATFKILSTQQWP